MQRDDTVYLAHMLDTARKAAERVRHRTRAEYDADEDLRIVIAHLVQTIGEAAARVSQESRTQYTDIPWKRIVGIRHRIVHDYMDIDYDILWEVATRHLSPLIEALEKIVPPEED